MFNLYVSFCLFAFVASITPGPTNLLAFSNANRLGVKATLSFIVGSSVSASVILLLTATGLAHFFMQWLWLKLFLAWSGTFWLSWMAFQLYRSPAQLAVQRAKTIKKLNWQQGFILQFVNPKTWIMAITVSSVFTLQHYALITPEQHFLCLAVMFFIITCPCMSCWAILGHVAKLKIHNGKQQNMINQLLAILLVTTIWLAQINATLDLISA